MRISRYIILLFLIFGAAPLPTPYTYIAVAQVDQSQNGVQKEKPEESQPLIEKIFFYSLAGVTLVVAVFIALTFVKKMQRKKHDKALEDD